MIVVGADTHKETHTAVAVDAATGQVLDELTAGATTAAKILSETAGVSRFDSDAKLARLAGAAPIPASSGRRDRNRLDRGGNRQLNCAFHRIAATQGRVDPRAQAYLARRQAEGMSSKEALRSLKRLTARRVWQALRTDAPAASPSLLDSRKLRPVEALALTRRNACPRWG